MFQVRANGIGFKYPDQMENLLEDLSFSLHHESKVGLVGDNGAGKSTLFSLLRGELRPLAGSLEFQDVRVTGYLPQQVTFFGETEKMKAETWLWTADERLSGLREEMAETEGRDDARFCDLVAEFHEAGGYGFEAAMLKLLDRLGLEEHVPGLTLADLSGGEKTKLALCRLLLVEPDLLLLDEPTNHLEIETLEWLEEYLSECTVPYIVISHDRRFLDKVAESIWELKQGKIRLFQGNWSFYRESLRMERERLLHRYENQQKRISSLKKAAAERRSWAASHQAQTGSDGNAPVYEMLMNTARRSMQRAKAVEKRLIREIEKEESKKPFIEKERRINLRTRQQANRVVLRVEELGRYFDENKVLDACSFSLSTGARLGVIGRNGSGKSTLLRILTDRLEASEGRFSWAPETDIGYYAQEHENLDPAKTILEEVLGERTGAETDARIILGCLNIRGDMVHRKVVGLSPGERSKTALARIIFSGPDVLLLDEPTNHFELTAREAFEEALSGFGGTLVLVTHDRYMLETVVTEILDLDNGIHYPGRYADYLETRVNDS